MTTEEKIWENLKLVKDPEFGRSVIERGLIDSVKVQGEVVYITYHLTVPFCPMVFAVRIGKDIKEKAMVGIYFLWRNFEVKSQCL